MTTKPIALTVNCGAVAAEIAPCRHLADFLREILCRCTGSVGIGATRRLAERR